MNDMNGYLPLLPRQREVQARIDAASDTGMWAHDCPVDGPLMTERGEPCSWCGATEPHAGKSLPSLLRRQAD